jgi:hypothetical protein
VELDLCKPFQRYFPKPPQSIAKYGLNGRMSDSLPLQDLKFLIGTLKSGLSELGSVVDILEEVHDHLENDR